MSICEGSCIWKMADGMTVMLSCDVSLAEVTYPGGSACVGLTPSLARSCHVIADR